MAFLVAAVVFVGVLCALDLVLTLAVIRRLRVHTLKLDAISVPTPDLLPDGTAVPDFTATGLDGEVMTGQELRPGVLAFFSTTCRACKEQLPEFLRYLRETDQRPDRVLAVVVGADSPDGLELLDSLRGTATVVREELDGPVGAAFSARIFPTFYLVDENGIIQAGTVAAAGLAAPAMA
ncbi:TlpA disulfide reductase family protein [Nonomuraea jiangxiensis]|uniref:Thiol-disulfide isomerase or thioredoxin n=1 Tax=Nonomuraea jiangxiensis TaxID=633440 RepID=A0A1G8JA69_9ACTN|nr:TlpA disulfide reductase family protein [Nonomuraea jiangxiensis]SDI27973.1 Thiol-disulfide isomerase or thioredoxin [Nonomuraea jiangxiensis]